MPHSPWLFRIGNTGIPLLCFSHSRCWKIARYLDRSNSEMLWDFQRSQDTIFSKTKHFLLHAPSGWHCLKYIFQLFLYFYLSVSTYKKLHVTAKSSSSESPHFIYTHHNYWVKREISDRIFTSFQRVNTLSQILLCWPEDYNPVPLVKVTNSVFV